MDGTKACVPNTVITYSENCYKFGKVGSTFECALCDSASTAKELVTIQTSSNGQFKGCAQVKFLNVSTYTVSSVTDGSNLKIIVPASCVSGVTFSTTATVAVPKYTDVSATYRVDTGVLCRSDYANIKIWEQVDGKYVPAVCQSGYGFVDFDQNSIPKPETTKGCMIKDSSNPKYIPTCSVYNVNFECSSCGSGLTRALLKNGDYDCIPSDIVT